MKKSEASSSSNISERLTGRKPVRNEVTSERGYCRIILVARAIARVTGIIRKILYYSASVPSQTSYPYPKLSKKLNQSLTPKSHESYMVRANLYALIELLFFSAQLLAFVLNKQYRNPAVTVPYVITL